MWCNEIALVVDKINMVSLDLFTTMDLYCGKTKALYKNLSIVLGMLLIIIFLDKFF